MIDDEPAHSTGNGVFPCEPCKVFVRIRIILLELLDDVLAHVGVVFFDLFRAVK